MLKDYPEINFGKVAKGGEKKGVHLQERGEMEPSGKMKRTGVIKGNDLEGQE